MISIGFQRVNEELGLEINVGNGDHGKVLQADPGDSSGVQRVGFLEAVLKDSDGDGVVERRRLQTIA